MEITSEKRRVAEAQLHEVQQRLYSHPEAGEQLWTIATKFNLVDKQTYNAFAQFVGDIVLGFYSQDQISALIASKLPSIQGLSRIALEADIKIFLYPLIESNLQTTPPVAPSSADLATEITSMEREIERLKQSPALSVSSIQTTPLPHQGNQSRNDFTAHSLAQDMAALRQQQSTPTYTSSQADILAQPTATSATGAEIPPRWESA